MVDIFSHGRMPILAVSRLHLIGPRSIEHKCLFPAIAGKLLDKVICIILFQYRQYRLTFKMNLTFYWTAFTNTAVTCCYRNVYVPSTILQSKSSTFIFSKTDWQQYWSTGLWSLLLVYLLHKFDKTTVADGRCIKAALSNVLKYMGGCLPHSRDRR